MFARLLSVCVGESLIIIIVEFSGIVICCMVWMCICGIYGNTRIFRGWDFLGQEGEEKGAIEIVG
jgi:hypothetical protein